MRILGWASMTSEAEPSDELGAPIRARRRGRPLYWPLPGSPHFNLAQGQFGIGALCSRYEIIERGVRCVSSVKWQSRS